MRFPYIPIIFLISVLYSLSWIIKTAILKAHKRPIRFGISGILFIPAFLIFMLGIGLLFSYVIIGTD